MAWFAIAHESKTHARDTDVTREPIPPARESSMSLRRTGVNQWGDVTVFIQSTSGPSPFPMRFGKIF
jgi:hypothetical protein